MALLHEIEGVLSFGATPSDDSRSPLRDAEVIRAEIGYYRSQYPTLCAARTNADRRELHDAEEHVGLGLSR